MNTWNIVRHASGKNIHLNLTWRLKGDTLIQTGIEELEELGLGEENMLLVEKYLRIK